MTRPIKFRAWDLRDNTMHDVHHIEFGKDTMWVAWVTQEKPVMTYESREDDCVLMQFTGVYDATDWGQLTSQEQREWLERGFIKETWHGKEIWEGDCLRSVGKVLRRVVWNDRYSRFSVFEGEQCVFHLDTNEVNFGKLEVIGNIYENPELLSTQKE